MSDHGDGFAMGDGHHDDDYVQLIRGISQEVHEHEVRMAKSAAFDEGWKAACRHLENDLRENKRQFGRRVEDRVHREYADSNRRAFWQDCLVAVIAVVVVGCLLYLSKGN